VSQGTVTRIDEIPYDFQRRRLTVIMSTAAPTEAMLVTKGAVENIFDVCASAWIDRREVALDEVVRAALMKRFIDWSAQGFRVLAVASKSILVKERYDQKDEF